jgi:transcriptional regulator with XRE-family HTH domain
MDLASSFSAASPALLATLARGAENDPFFCAGAFARFCQQRDCTIGDLARFLGCTPEALARIALSARPRTVSELRALARRFHVDPERLAVGLIYPRRGRQTPYLPLASPPERPSTEAARVP